jgi:hypothetical protein
MLVSQKDEEKWEGQSEMVQTRRELFTRIIIEKMGTNEQL